MAMGMDVAMGMAVTVGIGWNHGKMLYYNITGVHKRKPGSPLALAGAAGGMANAVNDNPGRVRPVEDDIRVRVCHEATEVALVGGTSAFGMVGEEINSGL